MRKYGYLLYDLTCIGLALVVALFLRNGLPLIEEGQPEDIYPVLAVTLCIAAVVLPLMRTHTSLWRYTSLSDITRVIMGATLVVLLSNTGLFLLNRLEVMPRSVPPIHWMLAILGMAGARVLARFLFGPARRRTRRDEHKRHVLAVGVGPIAETYLQFVHKILQDQVKVEGFLDEDLKLAQRAFQQYPILGHPKQAAEVLERFHVHGVRIRQVVLTCAFASLSAASQEALEALQRSGQATLVYFDRHIGPQLRGEAREAIQPQPAATVVPLYAYERMHGLYPVVKRALDIIGALVLMLCCLPLITLTALLVAIDVGFPLLFWQQRPGRFNTPFRLYKFRTMRPASRKMDEARLAHKSRDHARMSWIGRLIRKLHLDELPQLYHILMGEMSFVGPRPLLPDDQPQNGQARLSIRPGVTGWAQVHGGDALTPDQKLLLDMWYIQNMSLWLDILICLKTLRAAFTKEAPHLEILRQAQAQIRPIMDGRSDADPAARAS